MKFKHVQQEEIQFVFIDMASVTVVIVPRWFSETRQAAVAVPPLKDRDGTRLARLYSESRTMLAC